MALIIDGKRLESFFSPTGIAVLGASTKNQWFFNIASYAQRLGFSGRLIPVNPKASNVGGIPAVAAIADLPDGLDFAAVVLRSDQVLGALDELSHKGITNILLVSSGFAETGAEGRDLQEKLVSFCVDRNILLMGPNCLGFMNMAKGTGVFAGGSVEGDLSGGDVGIIGQSGAASELIATKILKKGLGISLYVTTGNEAMLKAEDCLEHMIEDDTTRVVTAFMEGFRDIPRLRTLAERAAERSIPIVVIKIGRSKKGVQAASSHTGALAGDDGIVDSFLRQHGIVRVETVEELVETAGLFSRYRLPDGEGLAVCTLSGGLAGLYADLCHSLGIDLPDFQEATCAALRDVLPAFATPANPLDVTGSGFLGGMGRIVKIMLDDENVHALLTLSFPPAGEQDEFAKNFNETWMAQARDASKPVIPITFREVGDYARQYYRDRHHSYIEHTQDGFKAVRHFMRYARFLRERSARAA